MSAEDRWPCCVHCTDHAATVHTRPCEFRTCEQTTTEGQDA